MNIVKLGFKNLQNLNLRVQLSLTFGKIILNLYSVATTYIIIKISINPKEIKQN